MKDHPVDVVLRELREVEPADGMEARIAAALRDSSAGLERAFSSLRREPRALPWAGEARAFSAGALRRFWHWQVWVPAGAAVVALVVVGLVRMERPHAQVRPVARSGSPRVVTTPRMVPVPRIVSVPPMGSAPLSRPILREGRGVVVPRRFVADTPAHVVVAAVDEAGFPAPPLPLTEQERLLLRFVHAGDTKTLAALTPTARNERFEQDKAAVSDFFAPPPPLPELLPETSGGN